MSFEDDRERVRSATDLVALVSESVMLRQRGQEFWGCCPFHQEKSPSFHVNPSTGLWKCFGCGKGGDLFAFVMEREGLEFKDALRYLADRAGIEISESRSDGGPKRNRVIECLTEAEDYYTTLLLRGKGAGPARAREYLKGRDFSSEICRRWHLGYAPGGSSLVQHLRQKKFSSAEMASADLSTNRSGRVSDRFFERVMFPIHDEHGRCVGFGGRVLGDAKPKYLNSKETKVFHKSKQLYAFDRAKEFITAEAVAIVCEGYTDVIAMHEAGIKNVVATLGTALTLDHIKLLSRCRVNRIIAMFDGDEAGQRAAERSVRFLDQTTADLHCVVLPNDLDPADFIRERGVEALKAELGKSRSLMEFVFEKRLAKHDLSNPGKRVAALNDLAELLAPLKNSLALDKYAMALADQVGADVEETKRIIRSKPIPNFDDAPAQRSRSGSERGASRPEPEPVPDYDAEPYADPAPSEGDAFDVLSADERSQINVERELLAMLASAPDAMRSHSDRIASFSWTDSRNENMAWAMLSTPEGSTPAQVVAAAQSVCADAPSILAGGRIATTAHMSDAEKVDFLLDTVELYSTRRKVRTIKAQLNITQDAEEARTLFGEATELTKHAQDLQRRIAGMDEQSG